MSSRRNGTMSVLTFGSVFARDNWGEPRMRNAGRHATPEALVKTLSFAAVHFAVAFAVVFALTGNVMLGGVVAIVEPACNVVAYYLHEKAWAHARASNTLEHTLDLTRPLETVS